MEKKTTGEIIAEHRKAKGLTQRALADQLNITDKAVSKWERNIARPDISIIPKLSEILNIPVELLIDIPLSANSTSAEQSPVTVVPTGTDSRSDQDLHEEEIRMYYVDKVRRLAIKGILGFAGGFLFALIMALSDGEPFSFFFGCAIGLFCAGIPYGYELLGRLIGHWYVVGHIGIMLIVFMLKFVGAVLISWIAYPIALLYNLVRALRKGSKLRLAIIILLCVVIAITVLFWGWQLIGAFDKDSNPNEIVSNSSVAADVPNVTLSDGTKAVWIASVDEISIDSPEYLQICEDALNKTVIEEKEDADSGYEITSPSVLHAAYFLTVKDPTEEHWDHGDDVKLKNAIVIVSSYGVNIMNAVTRDEYFTWVYPNCIVSDSGSFEYDTELIYEDYLTADGADGVYEWLCEEYADMSIYQLVLPE